MSMFVYVGEGGVRGLVYVDKFPKYIIHCSMFIHKNRNHEISVKFTICKITNFPLYLIKVVLSRASLFRAQSSPSIIYIFEHCAHKKPPRISSSISEHKI